MINWKKAVNACTALLITLTQYTTAQTISTDIEWNDAPKPTAISNKDWLSKSAIIITEVIQKEYTINQKKGDLECFYKFHKKVRVNDEKGIEVYNKIKLAVRKADDILNLKARTILPDGKIIDIKKSAFKEQKEENGTNILSFAFEGVEKGAELEYYYETPQNASYFGSYIMQDEYPTLYTSFQIVSPEHLRFEPKMYGDLKLAYDSVVNDFRFIKVEGENLDGVEEEELAYAKAQMNRIEYKFAYNENNKGVRLFTWNELAKNIYKKYTTSFSDKDKSFVAKLIDNKAYNKLTELADKIAWIENYIKKNYFIKEDVYEDNMDEISFILKNKYTNETGMRRLMACAFNEAKIPYQIGFTTSRNVKAFDYTWDNYDNIDNMVMYFPDTKEYLAPAATAYRYPVLPSLWTENDGLFIKIVKLGDYANAVPEKRRIPGRPASTDYHNHNVTMEFNSTMDTILVDAIITFKGQDAIGLIPAFVYGDKKDVDKMATDFMKIMEMDDKITDVSYENADFESVPTDKPLTLKGKIHSTSIIEKAGPKYLVKVGNIIGRQSEMYEKKNRKFDIDMKEAHHLYRDIVFTIPPGYKVSNLNDININKEAKIDGKVVCRFVSKYTLDGNKVKIRIEEEYMQALFPKSILDEFRAVLNAAADFNKVTLVVDK